MFLVTGTGLEGPPWVHREHQGSWEGQAAGVPECHLGVTVVQRPQTALAVVPRSAKAPAVHGLSQLQATRGLTPGAGGQGRGS